MNIKLYTIIICCVILIIILVILLIIKWSCKCDSYVNFVDENNKIIDINSIEKIEQDDAEKYIQSDCIVLELGGRYGTVSAIINRKINNPFNHVVVEPDKIVWSALEKNKMATNSRFHIIKGFISNKKLTLEGNGYGATQKEDDTSTIPSYTLNEIETQFNLKFNTLVADCEGCLESFLDENPSLYRDLKLILMEEDQVAKCNYKKIKQNLLKHSFKEVASSFKGIYRSVWIKT